MNQFFLNLYIRDTEKHKTFTLSTTYLIMEEINAEKMLNFVD